MLKDSIKKSFKSLRPYAEKLMIDTVRGYAFGAVFGVFSSERKSTLDSMHQKGKQFAKISAVYSATEMALQTARSKDDYKNSLMAGFTAGCVGNKSNFLSSGCVFGAYSGMSDYLNRK